jgi:hypothetical protein
MIVSDATEPEEMVNKVIEYHDLKSYGSWQNNYVAIADDSDKTSDASLQTKQNNLTDNIVAQKPFINFKKNSFRFLYTKLRQEEKRYPKAREEIFASFEKGALVFNYLGHGGEDGLTGERVLGKIRWANLNNRYKYPLFITITCDFSSLIILIDQQLENTYLNPKAVLFR